MKGFDIYKGVEGSIGNGNDLVMQVLIRIQLKAKEDINVVPVSVRVQQGVCSSICAMDPKFNHVGQAFGPYMQSVSI